jgi:hypothetical protein
MVSNSSSVFIEFSASRLAEASVPRLYCLPDHYDIVVVKLQCSPAVTFINKPEPLSRERHTTRLITFCCVEDGIQVNLMSGLSEGLVVILTTIW